VGVIYEVGSAYAADGADFAAEYAKLSGAPTAVATYTSGRTNFYNQIFKMRDAHVQVLYLPVDASDIPQIVPQLGYYGLPSVQLLGGEPWMGDAVQKALQKNLLEGVIVTTVLPRNSTDVAYKSFENLYQQKFRKSLSSVIPALGYDAAKILFESTPRGPVNRAELARDVAASAPIKGATGVINVRHGTVTRAPFLLRFHNGVWEPVVLAGAQ
jgi:ABC-type branched-subunit amino acid transport system substrate-binding protein